MKIDHSDYCFLKKGKKKRVQSSRVNHAKANHLVGDNQKTPHPYP